MKKIYIAVLILIMIITGLNVVPTVSFADSEMVVYANVSLSKKVTNASPLKMDFDLTLVTGEIQASEINIALKPNRITMEVEFLKDGKVIAKRNINASTRVMYVDITEFTSPGCINTITVRPSSASDHFYFSKEPCVMVKSGNGRAYLKNADFESGSLEDVYTGFERAKEENIMLTDSPTGDGKAMKVTLNCDDKLVANAKRCEAVLHSVGGIGMHMIYEFDMYLPSDYVADGMEIVTQWHVYPDDQLDEDWRSPVLGLKISGGKFALSTRWDKRPNSNSTDSPELAGAEDNLGLGKVSPGSWTKWKFEVNWSTEDDGFIRVWKNGSAALNRKGPNIYNDQSKLNLKQGFYKPGGYNETYLTEKREIYFDNLKISYVGQNVPVVQYSYVHYDFEDFVDSSNMPSYLNKVGYSAGAVDSASASKYMRILSTGGNSGFMLDSGAGVDFMDKKILLSSKVKIPKGVTMHAFNFSQYSSVSNTGLTLNNKNEILYGNLYIGKFKNSVWHEVSLLLDTASDTADVYLDGKKIAEKLPWNLYPLGFIHMYAQSSERAYTGVDDFIITDNPAYFMPEAKDDCGVKVKDISFAVEENDENIDNEKLSANINLSNTSAKNKNVTIVSAVYDGDKLNDINLIPEEILAGETRNIAHPLDLKAENGNVIKVFVVNSIKDLKPLGSAGVLE